MITSIDPLASMAGMKVLQEGGNAFDAAVAAAAAMAVVNPLLNSVGGFAGKNHR